MTIKGSKEELIEILNFIKDKVIVTGSYAEGRQTAESDIDFLVKEIPEEEVDCEADFVEDTCIKEIIRHFDNKGIGWVVYLLIVSIQIIPIYHWNLVLIMK